MFDVKRDHQMIAMQAGRREAGFDRRRRHALAPDEFLERPFQHL